MRRASAVLIAVVVGGCASVALDPPRVQTRTGPASGATATRVVAIPATCGSLQLQRDLRATTNDPGRIEECSDSAVEGLDQAVRAALEFRGYHVIDPERVNAETARRHEVETWRRDGGVRTTSTTGARFDDVTPTEQARILEKLGATGLLGTRVWVGAGVGQSERRTVMVQVRLTTTPGRQLVWARRCELEIGAAFDPQAMERAARCAVEGIRPP